METKMPEKIGNVLNWASEIDGTTLSQAHRTSKLACIKGHVALMPDAHFGLGSTVGSVIPTQGAVIPAAVGVDLGCGMVALESPFTQSDLGDLSGFLDQADIALSGGVGRNANKQYKEVDLFSVLGENKNVKNLYSTAASQLGTLGSGNHFFEICLDERNVVWLVLHSGSRGIGNKLAQKHIRVAQGIMKRYMIQLEDPDLAYLVEQTPEFGAYIKDMFWAQNYALLNRETMMQRVWNLFVSYLQLQPEAIKPVQTINCHHNFTQREHFHGHDLWITRKGAIQAQHGQLGIIPGSMGTRSYIVSGLGNASSYNSCSHGAGRRMSRAQAKKTYSQQDLIDAMGDRVWNSDSSGLVDEIPMAYKDIDQVMDDQKDLVEVVHTLTQILNYKGQ